MNQALYHERLDMIVKGKKHYFVTLAPKIWFNQTEYVGIKHWFAQWSQVLGYEEVGSKKHLHVLFSSKTEKTGNITRSLERMFTSCGIPFEKGVTIDVKHAVEPIGIFHYITHPDKHGVRVFLKGWSMSWIQDQCRSHIKLIPKKLLRKDTYQINNIDGPRLVIEFADRHNLPVADLFSFKQVLTEMMIQSYQFHGCKLKFLYAQVQALAGNRAAVVSFFDGELNFLI